MNDQPRDDVLAAGAVLWRPAATGVELAWPQSPGSPASEARGGRAEGSLLTIALVHRPRYNDWSLPKGKLDPGESMEQAAVREIREETGVTARLGPWLCDVRYTVMEGRKLVRYWSAEEVESSDFVPGREIDELRWVTPEAAVDLLSHARDVEVVERFGELGPPTSVVLLVRHAKAGSRQDWRDDDLLRPLSPAGRQQSDELARQLSLFGPDRIVTAPPVRCIDTVVPLAETLGLPISEEPLLGEDCYWDDPAAGQARLYELAAQPGVTVVCSQGGVIPDVVEAAAKAATRPVAVDLDDVPSKKASTWVLGFRNGALVSADYVPQPR